MRNLNLTPQAGQPKVRCPECNRLVRIFGNIIARHQVRLVARRYAVCSASSTRFEVK